MDNPVSIRVSKQQVGNSSVTHNFCIVSNKFKLDALCRFIDSISDFYGFIFCQTKILTSEIAEKLSKRGYNVGALHGDMNQAMRNAIIKKFKEKEITIVVATDVAARGIDVANLTHVVNFSMPDDYESYVHRSGRTGRAGKDGIAITFISRNDLKAIQILKKKFNITINEIAVPTKESIIKSRVAQASNYILQIPQDLNALSKDIKYIEVLKPIVEGLSEHQLRAAFTSMLYDKFINAFVSNAEDIPENNDTRSEGRSFERRGSDRRGSDRRGSDRGYDRGSDRRASIDKALQEISINVGSDDGVKREDVIDSIIKNSNVSNDQIYKIRVIKRKTFIEIPSDLTKNILNGMRGKDICGRKVRLNIVSQESRAY